MGLSNWFDESVLYNINHLLRRIKGSVKNNKIREQDKKKQGCWKLRRGSH